MFCVCEVIETADGLGIVTMRVRFVIVGMFLCACLSNFPNCRNNTFLRDYISAGLGHRSSVLRDIS